MASKKDESSIISRIKSSDSAGIHALLSNYLSPITTSSKKDETTIQSLKQRFLPFINETISVLRTRLLEVSDSNEEKLLLELFKLCLDCSDTLSSPLDSIESKLQFISCSQKKGGILTKLVLEMAANLLLAMEANSQFQRILRLVEEVGPSFGELDSNSNEKLYTNFVTNLGTCALSFLTKATFSDPKLVTEFCCATISEYVKSPIKDKVNTLACEMCNSVLTRQEDNRWQLILDILECVKRECKENTLLIKHVIASKGIKSKELDNITSYLIKIAKVLIKNKQLKEAAKVLKLYCKASWLFLIHHGGSLCKDKLEASVVRTLRNSALFVQILIQINDLKIEKKFIDTLENWSIANDLFEKLPPPVPVLKKWVQMQLKYVQDANGRVDPPTLYSVLLSANISKKNIGIILEQELTAYEEMSFICTECCSKMQMDITRILLEDIYITPEQSFQKAQTLVRQGKALRVRDDGLTDCIKCLSEAIDIMEKMVCSKVNAICHQLGVTYCLHALCTQEAKPDSDEIFQDVKAALKLWLSMDLNEEGKLNAFSDNTMVLLYNVVDLIQLKGFMELSNNAYTLLIRIFKLKSSPVEKWLTFLWESRRLSDPLCVSPVNEAFINSAKDFSELPTINFWISNLEGNKSSSLGFQHNFSFLFANSHPNPCDHGSSFQTDITVEEVQDAALKLISNVSDKSQSLFVAGYLYRDLSQRLMTNGRLIEALSFATKALDLHSQVFVEKFTIGQMQNKKPFKIGVKKSVAMKVMLFDSISWDLKDIYLSQWKVMQSYLESTLQVGLIYEMMGNGIQAETHFREGWEISHSFHLPLFTCAFSYHLGGVYVEKRDWDSAKAKLECAKDILDSSATFCCSKCQIIHEVGLSLGDLELNTCEGGVSQEVLITRYTQAFQKLIQSEWRNLLSFPEGDNDATATDAKCAANKTWSCSIINEAGEDIMKSVKRVPETKISRCQSLENQHTGISRKSEANESVEIGSFFNVGCWHCIPREVVKYGLINDFINLKWEFVRRKLSMKLLTRVVKCLENSGQIDEWRKILLRSISLLVGRNPFYSTSAYFHLDLFRDLVVKEVPGDVFCIERAEIIQNICWYSLKFYHSMFTRNIFCDLSSINFENLASWLMVAFVLACEVPLVLQKVSTLLALMYVVSAAKKQFSLPSISKVSDEDYWSVYFHQMSIGTHFTCQLLSHLTMRSKGAYVGRSPCSIEETKIDAYRLVPKTTTDLPKYVKKFKDCLPPTTIIGISLLPREYTSLIKELLNYPEPVEAWILASRLPRKSEPFIMLLPVGTLQDSDDGDLSAVSDWKCPWGCRIIDAIVPAFKKILEEDSLSKEYGKHNGRKLFWERRKNLDRRLKNLLRNLQDLLFGSWQCLLLGEGLNCKTFDTEAQNLVNDPRFTNKLNESILKIILNQGKRLPSQLRLASKKDCFMKDCYIPKVGYYKKSMSKTVFNAAKDLIKCKGQEVELDDLVREPIILLLNEEVLMLPWESFPILRNEEVYRMPSISSIFAAIDNGSNHKEQVGRNLAPLPSIDPSDAFYLINPHGDLPQTEKFEKYFRKHNIEGKAGSTPIIQDLVCELEKRDLFIYIGHGSGLSNIPRVEIEKLKKCAATFLMGCSSVS